MRLKRLELYGYKSFAARTVFEFGEGIAAIIGPNGSGKSNIADAIRWVMGEQSYSTLRAKGTEDMIFAGTGSRPRMGIAEVLITLDNSEGLLPLEYSEVLVGRRAHRSGENEYILNGNQVRYRDVLEILGGAGLARSRYTVIGQGLVDAALALRPEARRALFEEAAGVSQHLRKREEALKRIAETERNLERVRDILSELGPRARTLHRQAERAEEHHLLQRDLEELQRIWYGYQWQRRQHALAAAEEALRAQTALLQVQRSRSAGYAERVGEVEARRKEQEAVITHLTDRLAALRDESEALRREVAVVQERQGLYDEQRATLASETEALASRREVLQQEITHAKEELGRQQTACEAAAGELRAAREELAAIDAARQGVQREADAAEARLSALVRTLSTQRARLEQLGERHDRLLAERDELAGAQERLQERLAHLTENREALQERAARVAQARQESLARLAAAEEEIGAARQALGAAEQRVARLERDRDGLTSRQELLARLRQEMTGYHPGVRAVMGAGLRGLLGPVVNLMHVPTHLEEAIEAALGARLQNVVTETWDDAAEAIAYLKSQRSGWATFLPLDTVRSRAALRLAPEAGVVGVGAELVQYEPRLRPVFEMLLGSVVVVEDLPTARRLLGRRLRASLFVTVEGETVQPSGALSGGTRQRSSNLVAQEREWQALPERIATLDGDLAGARQEAEAQRDALAALQHRTRELETKGRTLRADAEAAEQAVGVQAAEVREAERDIAWRANRLAQASKELEGVVAQEARLREELAEADRDHEGVVARVRELRDRLQAEDDRALRQRVAELETRAAVAERTVQSQRTLLGSHTRNLEQLRQQLQDKQAQGARLERDLAALADRRAAARERQEALAQRQAGLQARLEPARAALAEVTARRQEIEEERARYVERLHEAELAQNRAVLDRDRARDDLLGLGEDIEENLGPIELPDEATRQLRLSLSEQVLELPKVDSLPTGLGEQIRQLRVRLRRLGNVNPDAPQEYEALRDRQTFLETQEADLRQAIAALREVIDELDTVIDRDFADTVRRVDDAFGDYFGRLFGGGSAKLVLTDPEDLSKTGVDILARPPGKRQQNLSLLSGGERALTAAALLFALLKANPVPFCCLDEVDAALDEANVQRFRALLTDHARSTQFVVITHNRRTIEAATTIYGISMSERGVSQSISLRLPADGERPGGPLVAIEEPGNGHAPEPEEAEG